MSRNIPKLPFERKLWLRSARVPQTEAAHAIGCSLPRLRQYLNEDRELPPGGAERFDALVGETERKFIEQGYVCGTCHYLTRLFVEHDHIIECESRGLLWVGTVGCWLWKPPAARRYYGMVAWPTGACTVLRREDEYWWRAARG